MQISSHKNNHWKLHKYFSTSLALAASLLLAFFLSPHWEEKASQQQEMSPSEKRHKTSKDNVETTTQQGTSSQGLAREKQEDAEQLKEAEAESPEESITSSVFTEQQAASAGNRSSQEERPEPSEQGLPQWFLAEEKKHYKQQHKQQSPPQLENHRQEAQEKRPFPPKQQDTFTGAGEGANQSLPSDEERKTKDRDYQYPSEKTPSWLVERLKNSRPWLQEAALWSTQQQQSLFRYQVSSAQNQKDIVITFEIYAYQLEQVVAKLLAFLDKPQLSLPPPVQPDNIVALYWEKKLSKERLKDFANLLQQIAQLESTGKNKQPKITKQRKMIPISVLVVGYQRKRNLESLEGSTKE